MSKARTKEIDCWVPSITLESFARAEMFTSKTRDMVDGSWLKARLIIEIPERTVTISESEFDDAAIFASKRYERSDALSWHAEVREKLFGKSDT